MASEKPQEVQKIDMKIVRECFTKLQDSMNKSMKKGVFETMGEVHELFECLNVLAIVANAYDKLQQEREVLQQSNRQLRQHQQELLVKAEESTIPKKII